jgi:hypothetical protein
MITLHYAALGTSIILEKEFEAIIPLAQDVLKKVSQGKPKVFLLSFYDEFNKKDLTFISEHGDFIVDILSNTHSSFDSSFATDIYVQEYESYEEAYLVALNMAEASPLCYTDNSLN